MLSQLADAVVGRALVEDVALAAAATRVEIEARLAVAPEQAARWVKLVRLADSLHVDEHARAVGSHAVDDRGERLDLQRRAHDDQQVGRFEVGEAAIVSSATAFVTDPRKKLSGSPSPKKTV